MRYIKDVNLKRKMINRKRMHPLNIKKIEEGQLQVVFLTLRQYREEFLKK